MDVVTGQFTVLSTTVKQTGAWRSNNAAIQFFLFLVKSPTRELEAEHDTAPLAGSTACFQGIVLGTTYDV